jgi:hypothetical protein
LADIWDVSKATVHSAAIIAFTTLLSASASPSSTSVTSCCGRGRITNAHPLDAIALRARRAGATALIWRILAELVRPTPFA